MNKFFFLCLFFIQLDCLASSYVIKSKGYVDVSLGKIIENRFIYIKNKKIVKITNQIDQKNYKLIDLENSYLLPGFIDSHTHFFVTQTIEDKTFQNALVREAKLSSDFRTERAKIFLKQYINEGFTTVFDLGNSGTFLDAKLRDQLEGNALYPLMFVSGPGIATQAGQFDVSAPVELVRQEYQLVNLESNINIILKKYVDHKIDILKIYLDNIPSSGEMDKKLLAKILNNKYIHHFKKVTYHSIAPLGAKLILENKVKNVEHFNYYLAGSDNQSLEFATPTDLSKEALQKFNEYHIIRYLSQITRTKMLKESSTKILFGPDFYFHTAETAFNRAVWAKSTISSFIESGLSPIQILKSMTLNPALSIGMQDQIGQIKVGSMANIIAVTENPLINIQTIKKIDFVMNQGTIVLP